MSRKKTGFLGVAFLAALLLFVTTQGGAQEGYSAHYYKSRADAERTQKNRLLAIEFYKKSLGKNPDFVPSLTALGSILREIGALDDSRFYLERAYELNASNKEVLLELAATALEQNDLKFSEKIIREGLKLSPDDPDLGYLQAEIHLRNNRIHLARQKILWVLKSYPAHPGSLVALGNVYLAQNRYKEAKEAFTKARLAQPERPDIFIAMAAVSFAHILEREGEEIFNNPVNYDLFREPENYLINAREYDSHYVAANLFLGKIYAITNRCKEAIKYFKFVLEINRNHLGAHYMLGYCDPAGSIKDYQALLKRNQNNEILRFALENNLTQHAPRRENQMLLELAKEHYRHARNLMKVNMNHKANFEMNWARYLYPSYIPVHKELLQYYRIRRDFVKIGEELDYLRKMTGDILYQDLYEVFIEKRKEKLYYREGIMNPQEHKTLTPLYVFRFRPENFLGNYPDAGDAIARKLIFALQTKGRMNILTGLQRREIQERLRDDSFFGHGLYYNARSGRIVKEYYHKELGNKEQAPARKYMRYVIEGTYRELPRGLEVSAHIIDLETGIAMAPLRMRAVGRGYIRDIVLMLSDHIYRNIPFHGEIIKVSNNGVIVNLGAREGVEVGAPLGVYRNGEKLLELKVDILDTDILWAKAEDLTDIYRVQPGDLILIEKKKEEEPVEEP